MSFISSSFLFSFFSPWNFFAFLTYFEKTCYLGIIPCSNFDRISYFEPRQSCQPWTCRSTSEKEAPSAPPDAKKLQGKELEDADAAFHKAFMNKLKKRTKQQATKHKVVPFYSCSSELICSLSNTFHTPQASP